MFCIVTFKKISSSGQSSASKLSQINISESQSLEGPASLLFLYKFNNRKVSSKLDNIKANNKLGNTKANSKLDNIKVDGKLDNIKVDGKLGNTKVDGKLGKTKVDGKSGNKTKVNSKLNN